MKTALLAACALLLTALPGRAGPVTAVDKTQQALDKIAALMKNVKSFSADVTMTLGAGARSDRANGRLSFLFPDQVHMTLQSSDGKAGQTTVSNGKARHMLYTPQAHLVRVDLVKVKAALKEAGLPEQDTRWSPNLMGNPLAMMEAKTLRLTGTEKLRGEDCWVFEGRGKERMLPAWSQNWRIFVAVSDGIYRQLERRDKDGELEEQTSLHNVAINPKIDPQIFEFERPKDAELTDWTERAIEQIKALADKEKPKAVEPKKE